MNTLSRLLGLLLLLSFLSCETITEEPKPDHIDPPFQEAEFEFVYKLIQQNFKKFYEESWKLAPLSRMGSAEHFTYSSAFPAELGDPLWTLAFADILQDVSVLESFGEASGKFDFEVHSAQILSAFTSLNLVDLFGDIPYYDDSRGTRVIISPLPQESANIYQRVIAELDVAIAGLKSTNAPATYQDYFYGGDAEKWIALANTLKLKAYLATRLIDPSARISMQEIIDEENIIDVLEEDFVFTYGEDRGKHPLYSLTYEGSPPPYLSNYFLWLASISTGVIDPRSNFYFYRQVGSPSDIPEAAFACGYDNGAPTANGYPPHYAQVDPDLPYCLASERGFWGRDHLNGSAPTPSQDYQTVVGMYPAGGRFDAQVYNKLSEIYPLGDNAGAGLQPIWLSSFTQFSLAEYYLNSGAESDARQYLENGITQSIDKVLGFLPNLPPLPPNTPCDFPPCDDPETAFQQAKEAYIQHILTTWDDATSLEEKQDLLAKQYLIALWGNPMEAYNMYRRTAKPLNMQPAIQTGPGNFPRSLLYPPIHFTRNENVSQKADYTPVFWDVNDGSIFNR